MARNKSVFSHTPNKLVALSVKVPQELKLRIDGVKTALLEVDHTLVFNVSKICCDALELATVRGEAELSDIQPARAKRERRNHAAAG